MLTEEQAEQLSKVSTAGMLNFSREDKVASAVLYGDNLNTLNNLGVILNRGSAGYLNEVLFTGFERFRAWADMPAIFGASNATRDHAQIAKKLDEYNAYAAANGKPQYTLHNTAHSLGVSGNKNMLNWSKYLNQHYANTKADYLHLGGSYPSEEIHRQAKDIFSDVNTRYAGVKGDFVYSGILGGHFIGNNKNAVQVKGLSFGDAHSNANQNINNLSFIFNSYEEKEINRIKDMENILIKTYPNLHGERSFNTIRHIKNKD